MKTTRYRLAATLFLATLLLLPSAAWASAYQEAVTLLGLGQYRAAASRFEAAVAEDDGSAAAWRGLGDAFYGLYVRDEPGVAILAVDAYLKALTLEGGDTERRWRVAVLLDKLGRTDEAREQLRALLQHDPKNLDARAELAALLARDEATRAEALAQTERVLAADPEHKRALFLAGQVQAAAGRPGEAVVFLERYLAIVPSNDAARLTYAQALAGVERFTDAIQQYKGLAENAALATGAARGLAEAYLATDRLSEALEAAGKLLAKKPGDPVGWRVRGRALAAEGKPVEAARAWARVVELQPANAEARLELARAYAATGRHAGAALAAYGAAIEAAPEGHAARAEMARLLVQVDRAEEAVAQFEQVLAGRPEDTEARLALARVFLAMKRYDDAIGQARWLLESETEGPVGAELLAEALAAAGRHEEALEQYAGLVEAWPDRLEGYLGKAAAHRAYAVRLTAEAAAARESARGKWLGLADRWRAFWLARRAGRQEAVERATLSAAAERLPDEAEPLARLGALAARGGKWEQAAEQYRLALERTARHRAALLGLAQALAAVGRDGEAIEAIAQAVDPADAEAEAARRAERVAAWRDKVAAAPEDAELHRELAGAMIEAGQCPEAARDLETLRQSTGDDDVAVDLARALFCAEKKMEAVTLLAALLEKRPQHLEARLAHAGMLAEQGEGPAAEKGFKLALATQPDSPRAHIGLGDLRRQAGDAAGATEHYRAALTADPFAARAWRGLGVLAREQGKPAEAAVAQWRATTLAAADGQARAEYAYDLFLLRQAIGEDDADVAWAGKDRPGGAKLWRALVAADPTRCDLRAALARDLAARGPSEAATREWDDLAAYCPGFQESTPAANRAEPDDTAAAVTAHLRAMDAQPDVESMIALSRVLAKARRRGEAASAEAALWAGLLPLD
jgi:tetratricopeptide (TPR) repeat protein